MRKKFASAAMVAADGLVRLPERSCDKYGADIVTPSALSAAMTSAEVCGPRPGGKTVSNRRFRRAENVVLIDTDLHRVGRSNNSIQVFADHRSDSYRRNQVQTWRELPLTAVAVASTATAARRARYAANTHEVPRELCDVWPPRRQ